MTAHPPSSFRPLDEWLFSAALNVRTVCLIATQGLHSFSAQDSTRRALNNAPHQLLTSDYSKRNLSRFQEISLSDCKQQKLITACLSL